MVNSYSYPHELYQNDQFAITIFFGESTIPIPVMTCNPTVLASQSW
ncbi:MAG: hypothetical protein ACXADY_23560 [Candidatus Hodarchaeales archaeon]